MIWVVWKLGDEHGCFQRSEDSWKIREALLRNEAEVWEMDMNGYRTRIDSSFGTLNLEELEKSAIIEALNDNDWCQVNACVPLGLTPRTINYKIRKHNISNLKSDYPDGRFNWHKNGAKKKGDLHAGAIEISTRMEAN